MLQPGEPDVEARRIRAQRSAPDQNGIDPRAASMDMRPRLGARDPPAGTIAKRDASIEGHGQFQSNMRPAQPGAGQVPFQAIRCSAGPDQLGSDPGVAQPGKSAAGGARVWILDPHDHARGARRDQQVRANGMIQPVVDENGSELGYELVSSPVQFDGTPTPIVRAPEFSEHTELVLMEMGVDWDRIAALKESDAIT